jgi:hypothetical protein
MGGGAKDPDTSGGVLNDRQDVHRMCGCRKRRPCRSCRVFVFMDAAETVASADGEVRDLVRDGDRLG